jgi:hypothetical protein
MERIYSGRLDAGRCILSMPNGLAGCWWASLPVDMNRLTSPTRQPKNQADNKN